MVNKKFLLGILVIVLVFGFMLVENLDAQTDNSLNGTWLDENGYETIYNNGNFQVFLPKINSYGGRGTYTTNNGNLTQRTTHVYGDGLSEILEQLILLDIIPPNTFRFNKKWYSKDEIQTELIKIGYSELLDIFLIFFNEITVDYQVAGNLLIITIDGKRATARRK